MYVLLITILLCKILGVGCHWARLERKDDCCCIGIHLKTYYIYFHLQAKESDLISTAVFAVLGQQMFVILCSIRIHCPVATILCISLENKYMDLLNLGLIEGNISGIVVTPGWRVR